MTQQLQFQMIIKFVTDTRAFQLVRSVINTIITAHFMFNSLCIDDHSRVVLNDDPFYINASHIKVRC